MSLENNIHQKMVKIVLWWIANPWEGGSTEEIPKEKKPSKMKRLKNFFMGGFKELKNDLKKPKKKSE